jgi:hypothetical protein
MGSTRRSRFTRARRARPDQLSEIERVLREVLDHLGTALAMIETIERAFDAAKNDGQCSGAGAQIATLRHAAVALLAVHEEFDLAIAKVSP